MKRALAAALAAAVLLAGCGEDDDFGKIPPPITRTATGPQLSPLLERCLAEAARHPRAERFRIAARCVERYGEGGRPLTVPKEVRGSTQDPRYLACLGAATPIKSPRRKLRAIERCNRRYLGTR